MRRVHFYGRNFNVPRLKSGQTLKRYFGGDIQKFLEKLPGFVWAKYKGEKHFISALESQGFSVSSIKRIRTLSTRLGRYVHASMYDGKIFYLYLKNEHY